MKFGQGAGDVRTFDWRLNPLQRKLEWEVERAKMRLSAAVRETAEARRVVDDLEHMRSEQSRIASACLQSRPDPRSHRNALAYLSSASSQVEAARSRQHSVEEAEDAARRMCVEAQRSLDALLSARDARWNTHVCESVRSAAKDADAAWLAARFVQSRQR